MRVGGSIMNGWLGALIMLAILAIPAALVIWFVRRPGGGLPPDDGPRDTIADQGKALGPTGRVRPK
jgi:hypothetical protein